MLYLHLNEENVCEILLYADMHSAQCLKARAIEYITSHAGQVVLTTGYCSVKEPAARRAGVEWKSHIDDSLEGRRRS